jgi:hypothetical protein
MLGVNSTLNSASRRSSHIARSNAAKPKLVPDGNLGVLSIARGKGIRKFCSIAFPRGQLAWGLG